MKSVLKVCVMIILLSIAVIIPSSAQGSLSCGGTHTRLSTANSSSVGIRSQASGYAKVMENVRWSSDGNLLLGMMGRRIRVLCNLSGTPVIVPNQRVFEDYSLNSTNRYVIFSTGDELILADLTNGNQITQTTTYSATSLSFFPTGRRVAVGNGNGVLQIWDTTGFTWSLVASNRPIPDDLAVGPIAISPNGQQLVGYIQGQGLFVWDLSTLPNLNNPVAIPGASSVTDIDFSSSGRLVISRWVSVVTRPNILVFDPMQSNGVSTWQLTYTISNIGQNTVEVEFSPDGALIASYTYTGEGQPTQVKLWDAATGAPVGTLNQVTDMTFHGIAFRPDGGLLAVSSDKEVKLWGVQP